jgi:hypothetical protein
MESTKIKIEIVKLTYSDFRELLFEFYDPPTRSLPKNISELIVWRYLQKQGLKVMKLTLGWEDEQVFIAMAHDSPPVPVQLPDGRWAVVSQIRMVKLDKEKLGLGLDDEANWQEWRELDRKKAIKRIRGIPDFLAYRNPSDFFFAEAKAEWDSIRSPQLEWIAKHPQIRVVFFLVEGREGWLPKFAEEIGEKEVIILSQSERNRSEEEVHPAPAQVRN